MLPTDYDRRFLEALSPVTSATNSPVKPSVALRNGSPLTSPTKFRIDGGDRYIPLRASDEWNIRYQALNVTTTVKEGTGARRNLTFLERGRMGMEALHLPYTPPIVPATSSSTASTNQGNNTGQGSGQASNSSQSNAEEIRFDHIVHRALLRNELLMDGIEDIKLDETNCENHRSVRDQPVHPLFHFGHDLNRRRCTSVLTNSSFYQSPLSETSHRLLKSPRKPQRKIPKNPYKVLDAPELQDDFYLNLVDWSNQNMLAVGLSTCVYLWSAINSQVVKLCDLHSENDIITSVQWAEKGDYLAIGTNKGICQIWDVQNQKRLRELGGHASRIGCLAWNENIICSGSRDRSILHRDHRATGPFAKKLAAHRQEVCGLKWSPDRQYLASGGNDNHLYVWSSRKPDPVQSHTDHNAAVKALAWSPHHHGILVSGGGTADRCLKFWNTLTGQLLQSYDTGSQVCNVAWSKHSSELVSTHGYSLNQVIVWKYPTLHQVIKLSGHQYRVLYLAMSPDGESIVTGAGDETLRFWHVFSKAGRPTQIRSKLNLLASIR